MRYLKQNIKIEAFEENLFSVLAQTEAYPYDSKARLYEMLVSSKIYNRLLWGTSPEDYKKFAKEAIQASTGPLLEVGCGGLAQTLDAYVHTKRFCVLVDQSREMLKIAKERISIFLKPFPLNFNLLQADGFNLPFNDRTFETVCCFGTLHLFDDKEKLLSELSRVVQKNGTIYISALTSTRYLSRVYMNQLKKAKEFGIPWEQKDYLSLFDQFDLSGECFMKGSMLFSKLR